MYPKSHKEKERLRHQKQVKLLNHVMEHVPKVSNEPQTKVRKLRRLILYTHYLRMVHSEITKKYTGIDDCENSVMNKAMDLTSDSRKSPCKPVKNLRSRRANIVFLQADNSLNSTRKAQENYVHDDSSQCNDKESTALSTGYEYEMPELIPIRDIMSMQFDPEATCISENAYHSQIDTECNISLKDQESSKSESINVYKQAFKNLESSLSTRSLSDIDKESYKPVFNSPVTGEDELTEELSLYKDSPTSPNSEDTSIANHKSNNFHVHSQQDYNILKESKFSNNENVSNNFSHTILDRNQESLLNSLDTDHSQNVSSDYGFFNLPDEPQITYPYYNNFFHSDFPFTFVSKMLPKNESPLAENASSDTSSCPSNDKISIDIENISDSNPSCNSLSDCSNSAQSNFYDTYPDSGHSSFKITDKQNHPIDESMVYEPMGIGYTSLSMHTPNYTCLGKNILRHDSSNKAMYNIPYPYVNSIYPPSIPFNKSSYGIPFFSESSPKSYRKHENKNYVGSDSFYLPPFNDSFQNEEYSFIQPKLEVVDNTYASESFCKENVKPSFFEEEASYPLSQYFSIDK